MAGPVVPDGDGQRDPRPATGRPFVPDGFVPPPPPASERFRMEPLGAQHNEADYDAWTSSVEHIHATPGFEKRRWPHPMTLGQNLADLEGHARDFELRLGFTYTVLEPHSGDVVGCVYVYPSDDPGVDAQVRSWVRASHAQLDEELARTVDAWLRSDAWPFQVLAYR